MKAKVIFREASTVAKLADEIRELCEDTQLSYKHHTVNQIERRDGAAVYTKYQAIIVMEEHGN